MIKTVQIRSIDDTTAGQENLICPGLVSPKKITEKLSYNFKKSLSLNSYIFHIYKLQIDPDTNMECPL